jgi:hypothetical protein
VTSKTVKFEISLKELVVKFEGSIDQAKEFQGEVTGALHSLASTQARMLGPAKPAMNPVAPASTTRRSSRKRRSSSSTVGIDPAILDGLPEPNGTGIVDAPVIDISPSRTRRNGTGTTTLVLSLKAERLFATKQKIAAIKEALAKKGHTFQSNEISPILVSLTKKGDLKREKDPTDGQWSYYAE